MQQHVQSERQLGVLVEKTLQTVERLRQYDLPEEQMLFLPFFFEKIEIPQSLYKKVFESVLLSCCSAEHPNLFE